MTVAPWLLLILGVALVVAIIVALHTNPKPATPKPLHQPRHRRQASSPTDRDPLDLPLVADGDTAPDTETDQ